MTHLALHKIRTMTELNPVEALYLSARRHKIALKDLSVCAGNHPSTFRRWMAGDASPRLADITRYEKALALLISEKEA